LGAVVDVAFLEEDVKVWRRNWLLGKRCDSRCGFPEEDVKVWCKNWLFDKRGAVVELAA
jgi:hypothetical protein